MSVARTEKIKLAHYASIALLVVAAGCNASHSNEIATNVEDVAIPVVRVTRAQLRTLPSTVHVHGMLAPDESAVVGAKVPGRIAEVQVDVGDIVPAGQSIARLDDVQLKLEIRHAETLLSQACAAIGITAEESTDDIVPEDSPVVRQEKAVLDQAKQAFERAESLLQQDAATQEQVDELEAAYKVAAARHAAALNTLAEKIALIAVRRAEVDVAKNALAESTILAPFDGLIQERSTAAGAYVRAGDPVVTMVRCDRLRFVGAIPEKQAHLIAAGQEVHLQMRNESRPRIVQVSRFRPLIDPMSRALIFEADVPNPNFELRPGLFAEGDVVVDPRAQAVAVPRTAVREFAGIEKVWRVVNDEAEEVPVQTGPLLENEIVVLSGLEAGDEVIIDAAQARSGKVIIDGAATPGTN